MSFRSVRQDTTMASPPHSPTRHSLISPHGSMRSGHSSHSHRQHYLSDMDIGTYDFHNASFASRFSTYDSSETSSFLSCSENTLLASLDLLQQVTSEAYIQEWELTRLVSTLAVAVLRDGITALQILHTTSEVPPAELSLDWLLGNKTLGELLEGGIFDDRIQTHVKSRLEMDQEKIESDRALIEVVLSHTAHKLEAEHNFSALVTMVMSFLKRREEEERLLYAVGRDQKKMMKLRKMKKRNKSKYERDIYNIVQSIGKLKDEVMDTMFENETKVKYLDNWENARKEQNQIVLDTKEMELKKVIDGANAEIVKEKLVHSEIMSFLKEMISDHQKEIEVWMNKYDVDIDKKEIECQTMKAKMDDQHEALELLQKRLKQRQEEIDDYLLVRERRRQERAELYRRNQAATKIQAWWRGVMFRKGLGPYKKKRKGKKGDKGKKGSGGKKK